MYKKFSYATQRNTQCNQNAQLWYFVNAIKKRDNPKYKKIANYYLNGNINNVIFTNKCS